ncbi:glycoside hydrolase family 88 protein [Streptomyces beijiangensis]|uniref:Glycoside hydrolase family 88 protein n=2 Tax=Streptomyces beijiangensis TaxID=163361 RepID=A0A939JEU3_9ACTN|nr:glycoside hydrolase family 88 protein [Streptomyces beijiangensis]MBO0511713.1 glycoside hydrolase family 88 protein [Streptomyces beijiangensis]
MWNATKTSDLKASRRRHGPRALLLVTALVCTGLAVPHTATATTAAPAAAAVGYEAESAQVHLGAVATDHAGFTGTGFVDYTNVVGSHVEFTVDAARAGDTALTLRFANGTTTDRPMDITVNGTTVATGLSFPSTGTWTGWQTRTLTAALAAGQNTVRATATTANGGPNLDSLTVGTPSAVTDWSTAMTDSTMARYTPTTIGGWSYPVGLYLYGQYLTYQRTHDPAYLSYIKSYVDRFVDANGVINQSFNSLDSMQAGRLLVILHHETGQQRYATAAKTVRDRLDTYPRTAEGGFWHADTSSRAHQLWADGVYMVNPFLVEYGKEFHDSAYADDEAAKQLAVYGSHLQVAGGLLKHAWDESRTAAWSDPTTGLAPEHWCRAVGWYSMAIVDVLDAIPADAPRRPQLLTILRKLATGLERTQDPATGRWFQIMDKGDRSDNWTETSCSSMFTYALSRGAQQGYVDRHFTAVAQRGYQGVLAKVSLGADGLTNLADITIGTNVGDYAYYAARTRATNDFHGLGAFLIMNEQLRGARKS